MLMIVTTPSHLTYKCTAIFKVPLLLKLNRALILGLDSRVYFRCFRDLTLRRLMSYIYIYIYIYMEHPFLMFLDHTQRLSTVGRTPLDE